MAWIIVKIKPNALKIEWPFPWTNETKMGCPVRTKFVLLHLTKYQLSDPGSHLFPTSVLTAGGPMPLGPREPWGTSRLAQRMLPVLRRAIEWNWVERKKTGDEWTIKRAFGQLIPSDAREGVEEKPEVLRHLSQSSFITQELACIVDFANACPGCWKWG